MPPALAARGSRPVRPPPSARHWTVAGVTASSKKMYVNGRTFFTPEVNQTP